MAVLPVLLSISKLRMAFNRRTSREFLELLYSIEVGGRKKGGSIALLIGIGRCIDYANMGEGSHSIMSVRGKLC